MAPDGADPSDATTDQAVAVQRALARLRSQFVAGLAQRWAEIESAPPGPLRNAVLHRLIGAAGSYGLTALADAARQAEAVDGAGEALLAVRRHIEAAGVTVR